MVETVTEFPGEAPAAPGRGWIQPFVWRDPATIPHRRWLYGRHYVRRFITTTVAPGGIGKSTLGLTEALAMVSGRDLLGVRPVEGNLRVWYWNGEDPLEEIERRIAATAMFYNLDHCALNEGLMIGSGRDEELVIGEQTRDGVVIRAPNVDALESLFAKHRIDVAIIDPFVASHRVTENDNPAIDRVAKTWARVADRTNTSIELIHHARKGTAGHETTVEDGRGAVALLAAARSARVLNPMTAKEAVNAGVERSRSYFRVDYGKANLTPPPDGSSWFEFKSQSLGNGENGVEDSIGVVTAWSWANHLQGVRAEDLKKVELKVASGSYRENVQAHDWVGHVVADALGLNLADKSNKAKVKSLIRLWIDSGTLKVVRRRDPTGRDRGFVVVGTPVSLEVATVE